MKRVFQLLLAWIPVVTSLIECIHGALTGAEKKRLSTQAVRALLENARRYNTDLEDVSDQELADLVSNVNDSTVGAFNAAGAFKHKAKKIA